MYNTLMISAVVHTFNEELNIDRCLSSLSFADEIVVVDMGSTDRTLEIAKDHKARIVKVPYVGFVEPARNKGIEQTKHSWVLIVDADEEVPTALAKYLIAETASDRADYFRLPRKNLIFGRYMRHAGWWPDYQTRFFKKGHVIWSEKIHGVPQTRGRGLDVESTDAFALVHHHYQTIEQFLTRMNRYTTVTAKELYLAGQKYSVSDFIGLPIKEFISRFFVREGYKDGTQGLALSLLQTCSELAVAIKLWELNGYPQEKETLSHTVSAIDSAKKELAYWEANVRLKSKTPLLESFLLRIKRKLSSYG
jgi:(heptosyl)LPS beta-1,4-glucosyltransferase